MQNIARIQQRRAVIHKKTINMYILSQILGYIYPTKKQIDLKALLDIPKQTQLVPDIQTRTDNNSNIVMKYILKIKEVLQGILDVCSNCLLINPVYFCEGRHLCPICGSDMVNYNKFKFNSLKAFTIKIYKERLVIFKTNTKSYNPTRSLIIDINPGLNGMIAVTGNSQGWPRHQPQYECNYKNGLLDGPHKYQIGTLTSQLVYVNGLKHGKRIIESEKWYTIENFENGLLQGNYQKFDHLKRLIVDYNYKNGRQEGIQTTYEYGHPYVNYAVESIELYGPIIEITEYHGGNKNGAFIAKQGNKVLCELVYINNLIKCKETVHRDEEGKITYKHSFSPNLLQPESTKTYVTYTLTKPNFIIHTLNSNIYRNAFTDTQNTLGIYYYDKIVSESYSGDLLVFRVTEQNGLVTTETYTKDIISRRSVRQNISHTQIQQITEVFENGRIASRQTRNQELNQHKDEVFYSSGLLKSSKEFRNRLIKHSSVQQNHGFVKQFEPDGSIISSQQYYMGKIYKIPKIRKGPQNIN